MNYKRMVFWVLLAVFVAAAGYWFVHVPYRPRALYRVLPFNTVFMSHHKQLAARWDSFIENPLARVLLGSAGVDMAEIDAWTNDPEVRPWMDKLIERDVVIAHAPELGPTGAPAWIVAGWVGSESIRLRWLASRGAIRELEEIERHAGGSYWLVDTGNETSDFLSVGLVEGMLIGVFSRDPHAVRYVLDIYDGLTPGYAKIHDPEPAAAFVCGAEAPPDAGWFIGPDMEGNKVRYRFALTHLGEQGIEGAICTEAPGTWPTLSVTEIETAGRLLGGYPFALTAMSPETAYQVVLNALPEPARQVMQGLYETDIKGIVLLAAQGGDYAGTLYGLSIPSLIVAWPVIDEGAALTHAQTLLDELNATRQWGLVASRTPVNGRAMYVVESTATTPYARLRARERVAYSVVDGWFVLSAHARPLSELLERYDRPESLVEVDDGPWHAALRDAETASYGYVDISGGARTLRMAISAYSLKLMFDRGEEARAMREQLDTWRAWIDTVEPLSEAQWWVDRQDGEWTARFVLGTRGEADNE